MAVRRLAAGREFALDVAVEGDAEPQQILDARGGVPGNGERGLLIHDAGARRHRVGGMGFRRIARLDGHRDAALRPGARCAVADRRAGQHGDRPGAELQRREEARQPRADDQNVAGIDDVTAGVAHRDLSILPAPVPHVLHRKR